MVAPQMPRSRPIGQAVLHHQAHRQAYDPVGVVAARRSQVGQVGAEAEAARPAAVLGVSHAQLAWPITTQAADLMQRAVPQAVAWGWPTATRAGAEAVVPRAALLQRRRQILHTGDALGRIRGVFARSHARLSRAMMLWKAQRNCGRRSREYQLPCYSVSKAWHSARTADGWPPPVGTRR